MSVRRLVNIYEKGGRGGGGVERHLIRLMGMTLSRNGVSPTTLKIA